MIIKIYHPQTSARSIKYLDENLNLNIGQTLKIIKGKDRSKQGCAVLTMNDEFIGFIPSPKREIIWNTLDENPNLTVKAEIIDYDCSITIIEDGLHREVEGAKTSITINIQFIDNAKSSKFNKVNLVGFNYIDPLPELNEGDPIKILHDNENTYDKLALMVVKEIEKKDIKIGYIPMNFFAREDLISKLMVEKKIFGTINRIKKNGNELKFIELLIQK
jgi:hypothetical protein